MIRPDFGDPTDPSPPEKKSNWGFLFLAGLVFARMQWPSLFGFPRKGG